MFLCERKGARRRGLDVQRTSHLAGDPEHPKTLVWVGEEPARNQERNRTLNCHYKPGTKSTRKKGRNRFKTGHKAGKKK